jgi:hypothetical protein
MRTIWLLLIVSLMLLSLNGAGQDIWGCLACNAHCGGDATCQANCAASDVCAAPSLKGGRQ